MLKYINFQVILRDVERMDGHQIKEKVRKVFLDVFAMDEGRFHFGMTSGDIKEWDSLSHMNLVSGLESEFGLSMEIDEISEMDSVKKVIEVVEKKLGVKK
jgi:acyl carrier protein